MKYMGSKARIAKDILPIILANRQKNQWYVEPFAGGMNLIDKVDGNRLANDSHYYLIEMWKELLSGWMPNDISKEEYESVKVNRDGFPAHLTGWIGFNCAHSGKWFRGYAGKIITKEGNTRDYQAEARKNIAKQVEKMQGVVLVNGSYSDLNIPANSVVYCDPPYKGTEKYADTIDHQHFWNWVREKTQEGHEVFVSEYSAPNDFECLWEKEVISSISANSVHSKSTKSIEKLFRYKG